MKGFVVKSGSQGVQDTVSHDRIREVGAKAKAANADVLLALPVLLIALIPLFANWRFASRAGNHFTQEWARDYLNSLEPYAIVVTNGDNDTFPLWYAQEVEGVRQDVTVARWVAPLVGSTFAASRPATCDAT